MIRDICASSLDAVGWHPRSGPTVTLRVACVNIHYIGQTCRPIRLLGAFPADLLVALDRSQLRGLRAQLERGLRDAIQQGRLPVGSTLSASRTLGRELEWPARSSSRRTASSSPRATSRRARAPAPACAPRAVATASSAVASERRDGVSARCSAAYPTRRAFPAASGCATTALCCGPNPTRRSATPNPKGNRTAPGARRLPRSRPRGAHDAPARLLICAGFAKG